MLRQCLAVTSIGISSLPSRPGNALVSILGIAALVAVLIPIAALSTNFVQTLDRSGRDDRAIVLRAGSGSESASTLSLDDGRTIANAGIVARDDHNIPIASADSLMIVSIPRAGDGTPSNVALRGVSQQWHALRPEIKIVEGRAFQPGHHEVMAGRAAQSRFANLAVGDKVNLRDQDWTVVGAYTSGDARESELMADVDTVIAASGRSAYQSVTVKLNKPSDLDAFKAALSKHAALTVDITDEPTYYKRLSSLLAPLLKLFVYGIGGLMGLGAMFAAMNTMYAAVEARRRDTAILRIIGFSAPAVVTSVLLETLLLIAAGFAIGTSVAVLLFGNHVMSTLSANFTQVVFKLVISPGIIIAVGLWALFAGLLGGVFPAVSASRRQLAILSRA